MKENCLKKTQIKTERKRFSELLDLTCIVISLLSNPFPDPLSLLFSLGSFASEIFTSLRNENGCNPAWEKKYLIKKGFENLRITV